MPANTTSLLSGLGISGYALYEPAVLAALATEAPLLLIGPHGTAKSLLINRIAEALGCTHRHYNASLLCFDDLIGFPFPSEDKTRLEYLSTPSTIWEAQSVFLDEISRCRPEMQNKLFPLIHEKVVQGLPLTNLRYRWAAMNPPSTQDDDESLSNYHGSRPLDPALADRFAFILDVPGYQQLSRDEQFAVLRGDSDTVAGDPEKRLASAVQRTKDILPVVKEKFTQPIAEYVQCLAGKLDAMRLPVSPRRGYQIVRNILGVHAARLVQAYDPDLYIADSAYLALRCSLPHACSGKKIDHAALLAAHRSAWEIVKIPIDDPARLVDEESDPIKKLSLALNLSLPGTYASTIVLDILTAQSPAHQRAVATAILPLVQNSPSIPAAAFDTIAEAAIPVITFSSVGLDLPRGGARHLAWKETVDLLASRRRTDQAGEALLNNLCMSLFRDNVSFDASELIAYWDALIDVLWAGKERAHELAA